MERTLIFKINSKDYERNKYSFQKDKFMININNVDIKRIMLSNKTPCGKQGANKYYVGYLNDNFRPLNIVINHVLTDRAKFLKYVEIWNRIVSLFNKSPSRNFKYNIEYIKARISPYNENLHDINKDSKKVIIMAH